MKPVANRTILVVPSRRLKYLLWVAHSVAAYSLLLATLPAGVLGAGLLLVLASWMSHMPAVLNCLPGKIKYVLEACFLSQSSSGSGAVFLVLRGDGQLQRISQGPQKVGAGDTAAKHFDGSNTHEKLESAILRSQFNAALIVDEVSMSRAEPVSLQPQTVVLPFLAILLYRQASNRRLQALPILGDSLSAEDFRYLRIWLRWQVKWHAEADA